ncbi:MAG: hypothetical protein F6K44_07765, partial [Moorea sp. SIO3E2]|nr:hypothetical protein [Moorena sp. SIO3E2]
MVNLIEAAGCPLWYLPPDAPDQNRTPEVFGWAQKSSFARADITALARHRL